MKFKASAKGLESFVRKINRLVEIERDLGPDLFQTIGEFVVNRVQTETRKSNSLVTGGKLAPLSNSYKKYRKGNTIHKKTSTGDFFVPTKSNLTLTGQMLDDIQILRIGKTFVEVGPKDSFAKDKAKWATQGSSTRPKREFLGLDKKGQERITEIVKRILRKYLK